MMLWVALGCLLLGLMVGTKGMRALGRMASGAWRPGVGMLALVCFVAAAALGVRESWAGALVLMVMGLTISMGVRRSARRPSRPNDPQGQAPPPARVGGMSLEEARAILGVQPGASAEEVKSAYMRLIRRAHPDQGGTSGLAAQLNAARDRLLKG